MASTKLITMKKIIFLILTLLCLNIYAQQNEPVWHTDANKAINLSLQTGKPMFLFFTGSDWCIWCKRLVAEVFDKKEFKNWAKENIILLEVDFPKRSPQSKELKAQNSNLQKTFQGLIRGYPTGIFAQPVLKDKDVQFSVIGSETTGFSLGYVRGGAKTWILEANKRLKTKKETTK